MTDDDRIPVRPRLLLALARTGLEPRAAADFDMLAEALARGLPLRRLPVALLRLRRHLRSGQSAGASSSTGCRR
ncbi:hypothetical protein [Rathayibacter sp. VKM Ac-2857]|uniref:hypothetical protein n=1 Tax=Rathayibacter sp. VKM Ac-2857 TaxID=2739020 RepID=UPI0015648E03|nr:hypothetical protein [Rathayibacter sp. VKM Ac-2857]NQX17853.1 hypothetical protein [Rathayibacter sp. VKM Ac-2857]